ncbi:MAG: chromosomal replication initiator protein DnaA, partial [Patescibacteria group bacterium]|nr:chromosomal replication initiator protein DnaA [Patescibacteria group bacterium]
MNDLSQTWQSALIEIQSLVSPANYSTWVKTTRLIKEEEGVIYLGVPNEFTREWLFKKCHNSILRILRQLNEGVRALEYVVLKDEEQKAVNSKKQAFVAPTMSMPLENFYVSKEDNLNSRYTFDNFVVGPFNELAHAAAITVAKTPGLAYNPLFVYGGTGRGKTHLIQAVGNKIKHDFPNKKVFYLTAERFGSDFFDSLQNNKAQQFKEKYRKYDVIVMDDVQFFSSKQKFQEEFFHLFNTFYDTSRQLVFSADRHPNIIPELEDRIRSRFNQGMIIDISELDKESRMAIVRAKCTPHNISLDDGLVDFIADEIEDNIREIEGIVNVIAHNTLHRGRMLNLNEVKVILKNNIKPKKMLSVKEIVKTVCGFYNIEEDSIYSKTRRKEVVKPRQVIMYILREDFNISFPSIGDTLGGRDHTTIIHS